MHSREISQRGFHHVPLTISLSLVSLKARVGKLFEDETLQDLFAEWRGIGEGIRELGILRSSRP